MLGDPMTDLSVALEVDYFRLARDSYFVPVTVKIPGSELELAKQGGASTTKLDFIGEVKDAKGVVRGNVRDYQEIKLKGDTAGQLSKRTLAYDTGFTLPPGTYTLKFLTRENETGKMGTFETEIRDSRSHHRLEVPADFERRNQQSAPGHEHVAGHRRER